ncbi:conjugal transfer protein TraN [Providencia rettgeri]
MKNNVKYIVIAGLLLSYSQIGFCDAMRDASKEGSNLGKSSVNQAKSTMTGFNPEKELQGFTRNPNETQYQKNESGLNQAGNKELVDSELGQSARDSFINNPKDKISWDSDLIQNALDIKDKADGIVSGTGENCVKQTQNESYFTNHVCEKEETIKQLCTIKAVIVENKKLVKKIKEVKKEVTLNLGGWNMRPRGWTGTFVNDFSGKLTSVRIYSNGMMIPYNDNCKYDRNKNACKNSISESVNFMGKTFPATVVSYPSYSQSCSGGNNDHCNEWYKDGVSKIDVTFKDERKLSGGEKFEIIKYSKSMGNVYKGTVKITVVFNIEYEEWEADPKVEYIENCPIDKGNAVKVSDVCKEKGGNKTISIGGKIYTVHADCWYNESEWLVNEGDDNTCTDYEKNPNCTVGERKCVLKIGNNCVRNEIKYQCQHTTKTEGYVCGDKFYCDDGSCVDTIGSENNGFNEAVSQLAAISQAGKEMSGLDESKMKAFSGKAMECRKAAMGFSNCCKSSGWGNDIGLAQCNSEEKAIGQAKAKKVIISVGTYCSKKVLGVCLQKKSSYCVFDNKLARIVQAQGRSGQLGIGFGSAKNPDCRGISINELQRLRFDYMDFSDFYEDLQNNLKIPEQDKLLDEVNRRMKEKFDEGKKQ